MPTEQKQYDQLAFYTLAHQDPEFIHQYIVDAFAAQNATEDSKPISVAFGLIGLYLHLEKGFSGKAVQRAHMQLANQRKTWPTFALPKQRGSMRVGDVLKVSAGPERDEAIKKWSASVWEAYRDSHAQVRSLVPESMIQTSPTGRV